MPIQLLDAATAWSDGADVWFVSNDPPTKWLLHIDWHLGFQLTSTRHMAPAALPLMVAAANFLPTQQVVLVNNDDSVKMLTEKLATRWTDKCIEVWKSLGKPNARLFVEDEKNCDSVLRQWPATTAEVTIVGP